MPRPDSAAAHPDAAAPPPTAKRSDRQFPCGQCGAKLEFDPGQGSLRCPYCSHENTIAAPSQAAEEQDFAAALAALESAAPTDEISSVKCPGCAAEVRLGANTTSLKCPYCTTPIVTAARQCKVIRPKSLLPFRVTREAAIAAFRQWVRSRWFAPTALRKENSLDATLRGIYLPAWTYDCAATTRYTGQRGDAYYTTEVYRVNNQTRTRQVRKIRWTAAAGTVFDRFDDVLVIASKSLPEDRVNELEPWDLPDLVPYDERYLAGFDAESYQIGLSEGFEVAKTIMQEQIEATIRADIGGDEQRISSTRTAYANITFKHLLLPVWVSAYRFRNRVYQFLVNARTGEVTGQRPYSYWKIASAILVGVIVVAIIALFASRN